MLLALFRLFVATLTITISPRAVIVGGDLRVTCRIEQHADNRYVGAGIESYTESIRPLDGERGARTHEFWFKLVPCDAGHAYCLLQRANDELTVRTAAFSVAGCE